MHILGSFFQLVYFLPVVLGGGIVVGGGFVGGGFFVADVDSAADFFGALPPPFILLLVCVILRGAPLLQLFIHPMMRPPYLDWLIPSALCDIAGVSLLLIRIRSFFFVISIFRTQRILRDYGEGGMHVLRC